MKSGKIEVSISKTGIQIVEQTYYPSYLPLITKKIIFPGDDEWDRLRVVANKLWRENITENMFDYKFIRVDKRQFLDGLLETQYSWEKVKKE